MAIKHHPDIASLMSCSAGSQPEAIAAVVSSHLAVCSECRREVGRMQTIGVALFDKLEASSLEAGPPVVKARAAEADDDVSAAKARPSLRSEVPIPLQEALGTDLDALPWTWISPGIWHVPVSLSSEAEGDLRLVKVAPGKAMPDHGHGGEEMTLVLRGSYTDKTGTYSVGDVADLDGDIEHQPLACPERGCICLVASEKKAKFKGVIARLVQPFIGM